MLHTYIHVELWYKMRLDEDWDYSSMSPVFPSYIIEVINKMCVSIHLKSVLRISVMQTLLSSTWSKHSFTPLWRATEHESLDCSEYPPTHTSSYIWYLPYPSYRMFQFMTKSTDTSGDSNLSWATCWLLCMALPQTLDRSTHWIWMLLSAVVPTNFQVRASARNQE